MEAIIVLITCPNGRLAESIGSALVENRLAACVNIVPGITSIYRWEDKIQRDSEVMLIVKSSAQKQEQLKDAVLKLHSYTTPEFIIIKPSDVEQNYLKWLMGEVKS